MADLDWTNIITTGVGGLLGWLGARTTAKSSEATTKTTSEADVASRKLELETKLKELEGQLAQERQQGRAAIIEAALKAAQEVQQQETAIWADLIQHAFASLQEIEQGPHGRRIRDKATEKHLALIDQITTGERAKEYFQRQSLPLVEQALELLRVAEDHAKTEGAEVVLEIGDPNRTLDVTADEAKVDTPAISSTPRIVDLSEERQA
ncbi:hypothetical protein [Kineococcus sp. SYSU DK018]|uniref:hypothetical protein n=1 Tax=Kineococcus sp. SYSU DK018 TaxID=3383139 RepID=UPI003D7EF023